MENFKRPSYDELPVEFVASFTKWHRAAQRMFDRDIERSQFKIKAGINEDDAFSELEAIIHGWEWTYEQRQDTAAYLMSLWFDNVELK